MAAQLKILVECPERLWVCLEGRSYLKAAQHYLLARHIYSQLGLGLGGRGKGCGSGGVVQKLWQSVSGFKDTILEVNCLVGVAMGGASVALWQLQDTYPLAVL